ncbi:MAG: dipeptide epimerase [Verrucomicrobia bacterium]|nr:dipeptide epimerase [Verrucomicrobiota bacterium]
MELRHWRFDLALRHAWAIAPDLTRGPSGGSGAKAVSPVVFIELTDGEGRRGLGEAAPSSQYRESHETVAAFLQRADPRRLSFDDIPDSMAYLDTVAPCCAPAKCAVNLALLDGAARAAGRPVTDLLGVGFTEGRHVTSFTLGMDTPEVMARKAIEAAAMPVLKIKLGGPHDRETFAAVRAAAPGRRIRVDANQGWTTREEALRNIEWLASDGGVEFVEQPMPAAASEADAVWLKERSPLPLFGDESYQGAADAGACARRFHGVNVKLVKTGGLTAGQEALQAARRLGLKTMLGCMIESSLLITAAAHLADLTDHLDLDGHLLITNDPYRGVSCDRGLLSFATAPVAAGLRVAPRESGPGDDLPPCGPNAKR